MLKSSPGTSGAGVYLKGYNFSTSGTLILDSVCLGRLVLRVAEGLIGACIVGQY